MSSIHRQRMLLHLVGCCLGLAMVTVRRNPRCGFTVYNYCSRRRANLRAINVDGSGQQYFNFSVSQSGHVGNQGPFFPTGKTLNLPQHGTAPGWALANRFEEYYNQKRQTHLWIHNLVDWRFAGNLHAKNAWQYSSTPALLLGDDRILIQVVRDKGRANLQCADWMDRTRDSSRGADEGHAVRAELESRQENGVAFHLASPTGYQVWTLRCEWWKKRQRIAADPNHPLLRYELVARWQVSSICLTATIARIRGMTGRTFASARQTAHSTVFSRWVNQCGLPRTYGNRETRGGGSNLPALDA